MNDSERAVSQHAVDELEKLLKRGIYSKCRDGMTEQKTLKVAFKLFDRDNSGLISFDEFERAMERFGAAGVARSALRGLFDKYDADGSGAIQYQEFSDGFFSSLQIPSAKDTQWQPDSGKPFETPRLQANQNNPWLPSLRGEESLDPNYHRADAARRMQSLANPMRKRGSGWHHPAAPA